MFRTVTARLALWLAVLYTVLSVTVFGLLYVTLKSNLRQRQDEALLNESKEFEGMYLTQGVEALRDEFKRESESEGSKRVFFRLFSRSLEEHIASNLKGWKGLGSPPAAVTGLASGGVVLATLSVPGHPHDARVIYRKLSDGTIIQIGYSLEDDDALANHLRRIFATATALKYNAVIVTGDPEFKAVSHLIKIEWIRQV